MIKYFCDLCDMELTEQETEAIEEHEGACGISSTVWNEGQGDYFLEKNHVCEKCKVSFRKRVLELIRRMSK